MKITTPDKEGTPMERYIVYRIQRGLGGVGKKVIRRVYGNFGDFNVASRRRDELDSENTNRSVIYTVEVETVPDPR